MDSAPPSQILSGYEGPTQLAGAEATRDLTVWNALRKCTVKDILGFLQPLVSVPKNAKRRRDDLLSFVAALQPAHRASVLAAAAANVTRKRRAIVQDDGNPRPSKRARLAVTVETSAVEEVESSAVHDGDVQALIDGPFLDTVTSDVVDRCISNFIDRTGNRALKKGVCLVCARRLFLYELATCSPDDIPAKHLLVPTHPHPAHQLHDGALLYRPALRGPPPHYVCGQCLDRLRCSERPPLALANNMWVGEVPFCLAILTLPERLLVALYFPAAYVVKLFPKKGGGKKWDKASVNSGMRGNVSTYRMNTNDVADMVAGNLMPRPVGILSSIIAVTFVGAKKMPLLLLPDIFEVVISTDRLNELPEGGVPPQISLNARYSEDESILDKEHAGYVPVDLGDDEGVEEGEELPEIADGEERAVPEVPRGQRGETAGDDGDDTDSEYDASVFPLQAHGAVDVGGDSLSQEELFMNAAQNLLRGEAAPGRRADYGVRPGSSFINEYPRMHNKARTTGGPENANHLLGAFPTLYPYALGGVEVDRVDGVSYDAHVKWALQYADGRFRRDLYFVFQVFGVRQKRDAASSSSMQIKRSTFLANQSAFHRLKAADFVLAGQEEANKLPISNPAIRSLRKQLTAHEFSAPEVISYLMGWGDRFISHVYVKIYWDQITAQLRKAFPYLAPTEFTFGVDSTMRAPADQVQEDSLCRLTRDDEGVFVLKDQLREYQDRGVELESMSFYDYFSKTYDGKRLPNPSSSQENAEDGNEEGESAPRRGGRPPSQRVPYREGSRRTRCRVVRNSKQEVNLHFIGRWFPRDDDASREYYCAQMLLLLHPWRELHEIPGNHRTFDAAFREFLESATREHHRILENIKYFYECSDRATQRRDEEAAAETAREPLPPSTTTAQEAISMVPLREPTEDDIERARDERHAARDRLYGEAAIDVALDCRIFDDTYTRVAAQPIAAQATVEDTVKFQEWAQIIASYVRSSDAGDPSEKADGANMEVDGAVETETGQRRSGRFAPPIEKPR
ncbi:ATP-dependent DNA helicase [Mycena chlorophos]|uniref:ATP-dependent DNA helicase n=1 Tax=Mycena chlorophos TaxID=658473 RepID=A0A8H6TIW5_MYCCL|nr:ATP-dependent DNA helicase [Mycena chlorophos]